MFNRKCHITLTCIICTVLLVSCGKKELPNCAANCGNLTMSGTITDNSSNEPMGDVKVSLIFSQRDYCILCDSYVVGSVNSKPDGTFDLSRSVDTTTFKQYYLNVIVYAPNGYIVTPDVLNPAYPPTPQVYYLYYFSFDTVGMHPVNLNFYEKAYLSIHLHKNTTDSIAYFTVSHGFISSQSSEDYFAPGQSVPTDTTLSVLTAANIFTKIEWDKNLSFGNTITTVDSIKCTQNRTNIFDIYY